MVKLTLPTESLDRRSVSLPDQYGGAARVVPTLSGGVYHLAKVNEGALDHRHAAGASSVKARFDWRVGQDYGSSGPDGGTIVDQDFLVDPYLPEDVDGVDILEPGVGLGFLLVGTLDVQGVIDHPAVIGNLDVGRVDQFAFANFQNVPRVPRRVPQEKLFPVKELTHVPREVGASGQNT